MKQSKRALKKSVQKRARAHKRLRPNPARNMTITTSAELLSDPEIVYHGLCIFARLFAPSIAKSFQNPIKTDETTEEGGSSSGISRMPPTKGKETVN